MSDDRTPVNEPVGGAQELEEAEAQRRLVQYGPNEIPERREHPLLKFLSYFRGPIPWMIEAAAVLSALVRYALAWLVVNDQVKLLVYRVLGRRTHAITPPLLAHPAPRRSS